MLNEYRASVRSHAGGFGSIPCQTVSVEEGHLVITALEGVVAVFAPGSWLDVRVDPAVQGGKPEAG